MSDSSETSADALTYRFRFGTAVYDQAAHRLTIGGEPAEIENKPLAVLGALLERPGEVVTKDELIETVWSGRATVDNVVANAVAKLRRALGEDLAARIKTQPRIGYRFEGPMERVATGAKLRSALDLAVGAALPDRPNLVLTEQLSAAPGREVWLVRHAKTGERSVFKFARDASGLRALKREATLGRVLHRALGPRDDLVAVRDWSFDAPPFFVETDHGGTDLLRWSEGEGALRALSAEERLALALAIVRTVAATHSVGVLHRDLKPTNVLIEETRAGERRVRLIDFGSGGLAAPDALAAMGVTPHGLTQDEASSGRPGTIAYRAPEVAAGEPATAKSDVYALGILLWQILAGDLRRPLATGWEDAVADPLLCEDIAAATAGDPAKRLPTADALAERLADLAERRRHRAQAAETAERAAKAEAALARARARRPWVAAAALALVLGAAVSAGLAVAERQARAEAERQTRTAEASRDLLEEVILGADPRTPGTGPDASIADALARASGALAARFADDPETQLVLSRTLARVYGGLADRDAAIAERERIAALVAARDDAAPDAIAEARLDLAYALLTGSRVQEADALLGEVEAELGPLEAAPPRLRYLVERSRGRLGLLQMDFASAADRFRRAETALLATEAPDLAELHGLRLELAQTFSRTGQHQEAVDLTEELLSERYAEIVPDYRQATAEMLHGTALLYAGRAEAAEPVLRRAADRFASLYGPEGSQTLHVRGALSQSLADQGDWQGSLDERVPLRVAACEQHGDAHIACLEHLTNEGVARLETGDPDGAVRDLARARQGFETMLGEGHPAVRLIGFHLAEARMAADGEAVPDALLEGLTPQILGAAAPGTDWGPRLAAARALADLRAGRPGGQDALADALAGLRDKAAGRTVIARYERLR